MPRLKSKLPSYRFHKTSGQAMVCLDGRRVYLGKFQSPESREAYDRVIAEWVSGGRTKAAAARAGEAVTVAEVVAAFWEHAQQHYRDADGSPSKELDNFRYPLRHLRRLYGRTAARDFGPKALKAVRAEMLKPWETKDAATGQVKSHAGGCRTYANKQAGRIRHVFKWATGEELVPPSVHHGLSAVGGLKRGQADARESEPVRPAPESDVEAALPFMAGQVAAMARLQTVTGMRPGEACVMRGVDIDTAGRLWAYKPRRHKTQHHGHERLVYLGPKAQEILRPFLKTDLSAYLFSPAEADAEHRAARAVNRRTPMSCGNKAGTNRKAGPRRKPGERYTPSSYRTAVARACDRADLWAKAGKVVADSERLVPRWHPHQLRHNAATRLRKEYGLEAAQVILGHKTLSVTQVYAERDVEAARRIMGEVG